MRNHTIPKSALMRAYEEGYLSAELDMKREFDRGYTAGYDAALGQWEEFIEAMPDDLYEAMRSYIVDTVRLMFQSEGPPF